MLTQAITVNSGNNHERMTNSVWGTWRRHHQVVTFVLTFEESEKEKQRGWRVFGQREHPV